MKKLAIGIDIGGTNIAGGLINQSGQAIKSIAIPFRARFLEKDLLNLMFSLKNHLAIGCGIGAPGIGQKFSKTSKTNTLSILNRLNKNRRGLEKKINLSIALENDANCFALGETLFGAAKKYSIIAGITLGTGIGFGFIIDKTIYHGEGLAQEFGHMVINFDDQNTLCQCQNQGCLEGYVGKKGIIRLAAKNRLKINEPKDLYHLAQNNNQPAEKSWREFGAILGVGLANLINGLSPGVIVIGGNVATAWKLFHKSMRQEVKRRALITPCPIIKSRLENPAVLGAASLFLKRN